MEQVCGKRAGEMKFPMLQLGTFNIYRNVCLLIFTEPMEIFIIIRSEVACTYFYHRIFRNFLDLS